MKIVAAGTFTAPPVLNRLIGGIETEDYVPEQLLMPDGGNPRGVRPFNISSIKTRQDGSIALEFAVATARNGTQKYRWLVFGSYMFNRVRVNWIDPYHADISFFDANDNTAPPPWWWSIIVVRDVPDGETDQWSVIQTFGPTGTLLETPPDLLPGASNVGISRTPDQSGGAGYYNILSDADMLASESATVVLYDPPRGDVVDCLITSVASRQLIPIFSVNGVATNVGPWTLASYNFSKVMGRDEPTSIQLVNRHASKPSYFQPADREPGRDTGTFSLSGSYTSYPIQYLGPPFPSTYLDVWATYPAAPGRSPLAAKFNLYDSWTPHGPIVWNSSNPAVADVATSDFELAGPTGLFRLKTEGTTDITATYNGITSNPITITVVA